MEIQEIKIYKKKYLIKFGHSAKIQFCKARQIECMNDYYSLVGSIDPGNITIQNIQDLALLIYTAINSAYQLKEQPCEITQEIVLEWIGDDLEGFKNAISLMKGNYTNNIAETTKN